MRAVVESVNARCSGYVEGLLVECGVAEPFARTRAAFMYRTLIGEFVLRSHGTAPLPEATSRALAESLLAERDSPPVTWIGGERAARAPFSI